MKKALSFFVFVLFILSFSACELVGEPDLEDASNAYKLETGGSGDGGSIDTPPPGN